MSTSKDKSSALIKSLQDQVSSLKGRLVIQSYMGERYRELYEAHIDSGRNLVPRLVAQQLAIISLNVGDWQREENGCVRFTFPAISFVVSTADLEHTRDEV